MTLDEALDMYWSAAYAEGQRGDTHDTEEGLAQTALNAVNSCVALLMAAERERCAKMCESYADSLEKLLDAGGGLDGDENAIGCARALGGRIRA